MCCVTSYAGGLSICTNPDVHKHTHCIVVDPRGAQIWRVVNGGVAPSKFRIFPESRSQLQKVSDQTVINRNIKCLRRLSPF